MTVQRRNTELVDLLRADYQHRAEPNFAWRAHSAHMAIPMLRGFWPMSAVNSTPAVWDQSGNGRQLTYNGNPVFDVYDFAPHIVLDGTGDYLSRADESGLRVLGTETYVLTARRGITLGGWFYSGSLGSTQGLITKWGTQRSYSLELDPAGSVSGRISDDGTYNAGHHDDLTSSNTISAGEWFFAAFTWSGTGASTSMSIWLNGTRTDGIPTLAQIFAGNADLIIGGFHGGTNLFAGGASMCWLSAMSIAPVPGNDVLGFSLYEQVRKMFYTPTPIRNGLLNSLIAYWPGNEAAGNALDAHVNGLTLTDTNTVTNNTGHVYPLARQYTVATLEYHTRNSEALLQAGDVDLTLAAWVYLDSTGADRWIIGKYSTTGAFREYGLAHSNATNRFFFVVSNDGTAFQIVYANTFGAPSLATWYFVVAWHDPVLNTVNIQINNGAVDSQAHTTGINAGNSTFNVGNRSQPGFYWDGRIGPSAMWKSAAGGGGVLTINQRWALWNSGAGLPYASFTT